MAMMRDTLLLFPVAYLHAQNASQQPSGNSWPLSIGKVDEIQSSILGEKRILNIYLPEGYNEKDSTRYPVIYLLDGSMDEDFLHVAGLVQFNAFEWVARVPPSIVVGIANVDRRRDFTFPTTVEKDRKDYATSGHSKSFIGFLEKELQPYINHQYKTNMVTTLIGQSLAGLLAAEILVKKPALFQHYIIISPSLWWDNGSLLDHSNRQLEMLTTPLNVFVAVGKEGLTPATIPRVMEVDAHLFQEKLIAARNTNIRLSLDYLPGENHATIMHQALLNAFKTIYRKQAD